MKLSLLPTCYLAEIFLEVGFYCWCHFITDMIVHICEVWYKLFEQEMKYYILFGVALGVCFSILLDTIAVGRYHNHTLQLMVFIYD